MPAINEGPSETLKAYHCSLPALADLSHPLIGDLTENPDKSVLREWDIRGFIKVDGSYLIHAIHPQRTGYRMLYGNYLEAGR